MTEILLEIVINIYNPSHNATNISIYNAILCMLRDKFFRFSIEVI